MVRLNTELQQSTMRERERACKMQLNGFFGRHLLLHLALLLVSVFSETLGRNAFSYQLEMASDLGMRACADILLHGTYWPSLREQRTLTMASSFISNLLPSTVSRILLSKPDSITRWKLLLLWGKWIFYYSSLHPVLFLIILGRKLVHIPMEEEHFYQNILPLFYIFEIMILLYFPVLSTHNLCELL